MMMAKTLVMRPYSMLSAVRAPLLFRRCVSYLQTTTRPLLLISDKPRCSVVGLINRSKMDHGQRKSFSVGATYVNEPGSIDSPLMQSMEKKIKEQLKADVVVVKDTSGDGRHVSIDVISSAFEGQSAVNRQRMVYKAIWEELQSVVHAVDQMTTRTPSEAA